MSNKAPMKLAICATVIVLALLPAASAAAGPFDQIGGRHPQRSAPANPAAKAVLPISAAEARRRLDAFMTAEGFEPSDASRTPTVVSYVRFDGRDRFQALADCHGLMIGSPKLWLETLLVDVEPDAGGVQVTATGQFQVVLTGLVSGAPFKTRCKSLGGLEASVRSALAAD